MKNAPEGAYSIMVPRAGIEPARLAARDFESRASTYSAISATQAEHYARFGDFDQGSIIDFCLSNVLKSQ